MFVLACQGLQKAEIVVTTLGSSASAYAVGIVTCLSRLYKSRRDILLLTVARLATFPSTVDVVTLISLTGRSVCHILTARFCDLLAMFVLFRVRQRREVVRLQLSLSDTV